MDPIAPPVPSAAAEESAHRARYEAAWRDRRNRRRRLNIGWYGGFLGVAIVAWVLHLEHVALVLSVLWMISCMGLEYRWRTFACPRCHAHFAFGTWGTPFKNYDNLLASRCLHCRLREGEVPPLKASVPDKWPQEREGA